MGEDGGRKGREGKGERASDVLSSEGIERCGNKKIEK